MKTSRRVSLGISLCIIAVAAVGCSGISPATLLGEAGGGTEPPAAPAATAPLTGPETASRASVVLRVATGDSGEGLTPHREIVEQFERANPDIRIDLESLDGNTYYSHLLQRAGVGAAPDIMQIGDDAVPMFVRKGALVELGPYMRGRDPLDARIYLPGVFQPGTWGGKQYLLPKDFSPLAVYYNKKLFDRYAVPYPRDGWTWDDFLKTAQALTRDADGGDGPGIWGVQLPGAWTTGFEYWVAAAGGSLVGEDGRHVQGYMDSAAAQSAVQFYSDLYNRYHVAPPPADIKAFGGGNTEFETGHAAMMIMGHWPQSTLRRAPDVDLGVVGMPSGRRRANVLFWSGFGISSSSPNKEAAWRFLRFYAGEEGANIWRNWALPTVKSVAESAGLTRDPLEGVWLKELEYLTPRAYVFTPEWGDITEPALRQVLQQTILNPQADLGDVLKTATRHVQQGMDRLYSSVPR